MANRIEDAALADQQGLADRVEKLTDLLDQTTQILAEISGKLSRIAEAMEDRGQRAG